MLKGFRDFILRGNVVELAVAVVIGAAFNDLVKAFGAAFVKPMIMVFGGGEKLSGSFEINNVLFDWAGFVNAAISFLITAAVVYFVFVLPMNKINERRARRNGPVAPVLSDEVRLLTEIRDALLADRQGPGGQYR